MIPSLQCADSRFAKPRSSLARAACSPDRGMLSMQWKVPDRETDCYFLRRAKSNTKSTRSVLPRQGQTFCLSESFRKGTVLFFLLLQKEPKSSRDSVLRPRFKSPVEPLFLIDFPAFDRQPAMSEPLFCTVSTAMI